LSNKTNVLRPYWRIISVFVVVLAGVTVGGVIPSLENINFLHVQMSWISYVLLFTVVLLISFHFLRRHRHKRSSFLEFPDARKLVLLCQTPQTTRYLRALYMYWKKQHSTVLIGANTFTDFIKDQEKEGVLKYANGKWHITKKGLEVVADKLLYDPRYWKT